MSSEPQRNGSSDPAGNREGDELARVLGTFLDEVRNSLATFSESLDRFVSTPLRDAFTQASSAHEDLLVSTNLLADPDPGEVAEGGTVDTEAWPRHQEYRNGVLNQIFTPLHHHLLSGNLATELDSRWDSLAGDLRRHLASLPEEITRAEPGSFLSAWNGDSVPGRLGKTVTRVHRTMVSLPWRLWQGLRRVTGHPSEAAPEPIQTVQLRSQAGRYFEAAFALSQPAVMEDLQQHFARPLAALERAVARWAREWPTLEWAFDRDMAYLPAPFVEDLARHLESMADDGEEASRDGDEGEGKPLPSSPPMPRTEDVVGSLARALEEGREIPPPLEVLKGLESVFEQRATELLEHLEFAGPFGRLPGPIPSPRTLRRSTAKLSRRTEAWGRWHRTVPTRLLLAMHSLRIRAAITSARDAFIRGVGKDVLVPLGKVLRESTDAFRTLTGRGKEVFDQLPASPDPRGLASKVNGLLREGRSVLDENWKEILAPGHLPPRIQSLADDTATALASTLPQLPDLLTVQAVQEDVDVVNPATELRDVKLRDVAQQVLDVLRLEGIRSAPSPILEALAGAREEAEKLPDVLRFNLEAAREELLQSSRESLEDLIGEAGSLTTEGLLRTEEGIGRLLHAIPQAWSSFVQSAEDLLGSTSREIQIRTRAEGRVQDQIFGVRTRIRQNVRLATNRLRVLAKDLGGKLRRLSRRLGVMIAHLLRLGRQAVGTEQLPGEEGDRALAIIRGAPELLSSLPLIYRRLFSFAPLTDPALMKGRSAETAWVKERLSRWAEGSRSPLLLTGPVGAGHTSFFNILSDSVFRGHRIFRLDLEERIGTEEDLARRLAGLFELDGEEPRDFDSLASALSALPDAGKPVIALMERLEHIFLRTPGGTDLFEDFLSFQSRTSGKILWISSMAGAAWKLVGKTEPRATSLVRAHPLSSPSRASLEEMILARHQRSGLPLVFRPPPDLNPLVRRRLRWSPSEKARQRVLQTEYFDRLYRLSQESIPMAILHWLRSVDFLSGEGKLLVTSPSDIRYAFLEELDLGLDFALKAFLEHGSLTLEEYRTVFASSHDDSFQTFQALRSRLLLETSSGAEGGVPQEGGKVVEGERYRIPSLLSQVVAGHLRNRNILH